MKTLRAALAVLCIGAISLCAILIVQKVAGRVRLDLTQRRLYTLSVGTRNVLAGLNQPVHGPIGYHIRTGGHGVTDYDWQRYMDFADKHFGRK